jgi:hypothetical protein
VAERGPGDDRAIENPTEVSDMPDELEQAVRSDADHGPSVAGEAAGDAGEEGERVSEPGEGLVTEEGVNEPGTRADRKPRGQADRPG